MTFFSKYTQTYFEPYLETSFNEVINDNRNLFYLDKLNELYLYANQPITSVDSVEIFDDELNLIQTITPQDIIQVNKNTYKVNLTLYSTDYPDYVNVWSSEYCIGNTV